jgi:cytochrome P450
MVAGPMVAGRESDYRSTVTTTPTPAHELELPMADFLVPVGADPLAMLDVELDDHWLARNLVGFSLTRYDDVIAILRDKRWHSAASKITEMTGFTDPAFTARRRESILSAEGDVHTRLRRLVAPAFSPRAADRLRPVMRDVVERLVDPIAARGNGELVSELCEPYPIPIICALLGAPAEDWQLFSRWAADVLRIFDLDLANDMPVIAKAMDELDEYTRELIAQRRDRPADDLLTDLIAAEEAGDKLSNDELVMMVEAVIIGGTDTTRNQLGLALALFARHPEQWRLLADDPSLAPRAVDEVMRYFGAVRGTGRFASEDIVYRDVLFPAGTIIAPSMALANRDPEVFGEPNTFDILRPPTGQPHLTFGSGIHYCLGAWLARAELQEAFVILSRRLPDLALAGPVEYKSAISGIFGPTKLPVTFTPGH